MKVNKKICVYTPEIIEKNIYMYIDFHSAPAWCVKTPGVDIKQKEKRGSRGFLPRYDACGFDFRQVDKLLVSYLARCVKTPWLGTKWPNQLVQAGVEAPLYLKGR